MVYFRYKKKGNAIIDTLLVVVIVTVLAVISPLIYNTFAEIKPDIVMDLNESNMTSAINILEDTEDKFPSLFDGIMVFIFVMLTGVAIVSAFFLDDHPIFFIFSVIILLFVVISAGFIGNFYEEFTEDEAFNNVQVNFPMTYWLMTHLMWVSIITGFMIIISLYAKSRSGL